MNLAVIGVNHKTCPIDIREKVSFVHSKTIEGMQMLYHRGIREVVILSTCNRSEIYIYNEALGEAVEKVKTFYCEYFDEPQVEEYLFVYRGRKALTHLYEVAAGLDSIVIGEDQILGQVKMAHQDALAYHTSGKVLNKIFREAITTAKEIKSLTKMSEHALSISHIAVKFLKEQQGTLERKVGLLIGAGKMNLLTLKYLLEERVGQIYVINRTHTKSVSLAKEYPSLIPIHYEERYDILPEVDFVVSATASPHVILKYDKMPDLNKSLYIMDIAMPRDIDPKIHEIPYVYLYDIDDLKAISEANNIKRREVIHLAQIMIEEKMQEVIAWLDTLNIDPIVHQLANRCQYIEENTLEQIYKKVDLEEEEKAILEKFLGSALKRVIREPIVKLKKTSNPKQRQIYMEMIEELFELDQEGETLI